MKKLVKQAAALGAALLLIVAQPKAQELQCAISINTPTVQAVDRTVFNNMQREFSDYINKTRWTDHKFEVNERIRCTISIIINTMPSNDRFEGTAQVQLIRPTFNSTHESVVLNINDQSFNFNYVPFQGMQYSENSYTTNITSLLNYYALMILGFDYDTFSQDGGAEFFDRARSVLNQAAQSGERGWQAMDAPLNRNRYWLVENMTNGSYKKIHSILYNYHRKGLDAMNTDLSGGRSTLMQCVADFQRFFNDNQQTYFIRIFLDAKSQELVKAFTNAPAQDKQRFVTIMKQVDANNSSRYDEVLKEKTDG